MIVLNLSVQLVLESIILRRIQKHHGHCQRSIHPFHSPSSPVRPVTCPPLQAHHLAIARFSSLLFSTDASLPLIYAAMAMLLAPLASAAATARKAAERGGRGGGTGGSGSWLGNEGESEEERRRRMGAAVAAELDALAAWKGRHGWVLAGCNTTVACGVTVRSCKI